MGLSVKEERGVIGDMARLSSDGDGQIVKIEVEGSLLRSRIEKLVWRVEKVVGGGPP